MGSNIVCSSSINVANSNHSALCEISETNLSDFIIRHFQNNKHNAIDDIQKLDQRRLVFISLIGAYQTWKQCPSVSLYSALFLMPLKRDWIRYPEQYTQELYAYFTYPLLSVSDTEGIEQFINLLKWKDSQHLVFWMLDAYPEVPLSVSQGALVYPFWHHLSNAISHLYDPITKSNCNPLQLDDKFWKTDKTRHLCRTAYGIETKTILCELYFQTMKFKAIQTILYTSNSESLHAIKYYGDQGISTYKNPLVSLDDDEDEGSWWISPDYDPNECD
eukprot:318977_1